MNFLIALFNWFVKITGWLLQRIVFRLKFHYEDKAVQRRKIKGAAIIISNHTSVWDYAAFIFLFISRTLRYQMAELMFRKRGMGGLLKALGGIRVDRDSHNFSFVRKSEELLKKGKVVGVFPESRLKKEGEEGLLEFKPSVTYLALSSGVPIIPAYTDGNYFGRGRAHIIVGKPVNVRELYDETKSEKENIHEITKHLQQKIADLGSLLDERKK